MWQGIEVRTKRKGKEMGEKKERGEKGRIGDRNAREGV